MNLEALIDTGSILLDVVIPIAGALVAGGVALHQFYRYLTWRHVRMLDELERLGSAEDGLKEIIRLAKEEERFALLVRRPSTPQFREAAEVALKEKDFSVYKLRMAARHFDVEDEKLVVLKGKLFRIDQLFYWFSAIASGLIVVFLFFSAVALRTSSISAVLAVLVLIGLFLLVVVWSTREIIGFEIAKRYKPSVQVEVQ